MIFLIPLGMLFASPDNLSREVFPFALGVLNGMLGPTHPIHLCKLCLHRSGVLRDSPLCGPISAGSCLNHACLRHALNILFYFADARGYHMLVQIGQLAAGIGATVQNLTKIGRAHV